MPYEMRRQDNIAFARRNIVDIVYKEAKLEGVGGTYLDAKAVCEGGIVSGMRARDVVIVNNLMFAWQFVFDTIDETVDVDYLRHLNAVIGSNTGQLRPGEVRSTEVRVSGTSWRPGIPDGDDIDATLAGLYDEAVDAETRVLTAFARICRGQFFYDANKRTAQLVANKELIANGAGTLVISDEEEWAGKLVGYYESGDEEPFVDYLKSACIDGLDLPDPQPIAGARAPHGR